MGHREQQRALARGPALRVQGPEEPREQVRRVPEVLERVQA